MNTLLLLKILIPVYLISVNVYSFLLLRAQKQSFEENEQSEKRVKDIRLYLAGLFGGAIGVYVGMFCLKFRLKNFFLMVIMPLLIAVTLYFAIFAFMSDFWIQ